MRIANVTVEQLEQLADNHRTIARMGHYLPENVLRVQTLAAEAIEELIDRRNAEPMLQWGGEL